jgi:hypothetical protein
VEGRLWHDPKQFGLRIAGVSKITAYPIPNLVTVALAMLPAAGHVGQN